MDNTLTIQLTAVEKMDAILSFLSTWKWGALADGEIYGHIVKKHRELDGQANFGSELLRILRKLEKDGYVYTVERKSDIFKTVVTKYCITFEGELFSQIGGYKQQIINDGSENTRLEKIESAATANRKTVTALTWIIAIGTAIAAIYYAVEVMKYLKWIPRN